MPSRKEPIAIWIVPLLVGLAGFYRLTQSPRFQLYRAVDIVQFLGSGICFGATAVGVIFALRRNHP